MALGSEPSVEAVRVFLAAADGGARAHPALKNLKSRTGSALTSASGCHSAATGRCLGYGDALEYKPEPGQNAGENGQRAAGTLPPVRQAFGSSCARASGKPATAPVRFQPRWEAHAHPGSPKSHSWG